MHDLATRRLARGAHATLVAAALWLVAACGSTTDEIDPTGVAGAVVEVSGAVTAERPGAEARALAVGDEIFADDTIVTGADAAVTIRLLHNEASWTLGSERRRAVRESAAWSAPKGEGGDLLGATDRTSAAGRHAEREAAETAATVMDRAEPGAAPAAELERAAEPPPPPAAAPSPDPAPARPAPQKTRSTGSPPPAPPAKQEAPADGLGLSGTGLGGGGVGGGGAGGGDFGTIGRGPAVGSGHGTGSAKQARVRIADVAATGDLDPNIARRYVRRIQNQLRFCYERQLQEEPALKGTVTAQFVIVASGATVGASAEGVSKEVSACVAAAFSRIQFPPAEGRDKVQVRVTITFSPG